jgi:alkylhydroperoxidase family enzyme
MHTSAARAAGETEQRIYCLSAWRECPFYTDGERAALELTEALTQVALAGVPDELYQRVREHFSEKQFMDLVILISTINSWNRIAIATGAFPREKARG